MANKKKNFYSVKKGHSIGIFTSWAECQKQISGYSGAEYKGFYTKMEAEDYLKSPTEGDILPTKGTNLEKDNLENYLIAYIDGSYSKTDNKYSFGCVILLPNGDKIEEYGFGNEKHALESNNVAGELQAAMFVSKWAKNNGHDKLLIRYDYEGIEKWVTGEWKAKKAVSKSYVNFMKIQMEFIKIKFEKIKAHSGDEYNDLADSLAKYALEYGDNTKSKINHGGTWFVATGLNQDDLKAIIEIVDEETENLYICNETDDVTQIKYIIHNNYKDKITVTYYKKSRKISVQGTQSLLFLSFISYIVDLVEPEEIPKIFNNYFKFSVDKDNVNEQFDSYLSNIPKDIITKKDKFIKCLLQSIYYLNVKDEMFEYTSFVFPACRALEAHLKMIFDKHNISIEKKGNFYMFEKNDIGIYKLIDTYEKNFGSSKKINYINKCYNYYNNNRHVYFHWDNPNEEIDETQLITNIDIAHTKIKEILTLINEFYTL